jgi:hypothetical protein
MAELAGVRRTGGVLGPVLVAGGLFPRVLKLGIGRCSAKLLKK